MRGAIQLHVIIYQNEGRPLWDMWSLGALVCALNNLGNYATACVRANFVICNLSALFVAVAFFCRREHKLMGAGLWAHITHTGLTHMGSNLCIPSHSTGPRCGVMSLTPFLFE